MKYDRSFSPILVKRLLYRLYLRKVYHYENVENIPRKKSIQRTWSNCYRYNRSKLLYRHVYMHQRRQKSGKKLVRDNDHKYRWKEIIAQQKSKLFIANDGLHKWGLVEYRQLEKMNKHEFYSYRAPSVIWGHTIRKNLQRMYKRYKQKVRKSRSYPLWSYRIRHTWTRLKNGYMRKEPTLWEINIRMNKNMLNTIHGKREWEKTIYDNYLKMKRRG